MPILSISFFIYSIISLSFNFSELYNQKVKIIKILLEEEKEEKLNVLEKKVKGENTDNIKTE